MTKYVVQTSWDDSPHLSAGAKADLARAYPPHERDARMRGVPQLGSGAIYPVPESDIVIDPIELPLWYRHVYALDVGWNRTAALWGAIDVESDVLYLYSEHYRGQAEPAVHAQAIRARGEWIPGVIDPAARGRTQGDGTQLLHQYRELGLSLSLANNAVEAGLYEVWTRLSSGRIKVFRTLVNFLAEYRMYRRDDKGHVVKENDHLVDCARYLTMTGRSLAITRPRDQWDRIKPSSSSHRIDYDPFGPLYTPEGGGEKGRAGGIDYHLERVRGG